MSEKNGIESATGAIVKDSHSQLSIIAILSKVQLHLLYSITCLFQIQLDNGE